MCSDNYLYSKKYTYYVHMGQSQSAFCYISFVGSMSEDCMLRGGYLIRQRIAYVIFCCNLIDVSPASCIDFENSQLGMTTQPLIILSKIDSNIDVGAALHRHCSVFKLASRLTVPGVPTSSYLRNPTLAIDRRFLKNLYKRFFFARTGCFPFNWLYW